MSDTERRQPPPRPEWAGPPRYLPPPEPRVTTTGTVRYEGVTYGAVVGYRPLQLDVWRPASVSSPPLVVWIHGGAWMFGDRRYLPETLRPNQLFDDLTAAGLAVATIDYRHALEARFPAQLHDAKAAIRYLRAHAEVFGVDTTRIGVWGESAGGHLAALVGLTGDRSDLVDLEGEVGLTGPSSAVDVVVDWYGVADLRLQDSSPTAPEALLIGDQDPALASPISYVTPTAPPFLLVHGTVDAVVPYVHSERLAAALAAAGVPVELVDVEGAGHIFQGHADIDTIVERCVHYLADALLDR